MLPLSVRTDGELQPCPVPWGFSEMPVPPGAARGGFTAEGADNAPEDGSDTPAEKIQPHKKHQDPAADVKRDPFGPAEPGEVNQQKGQWNASHADRRGGGGPASVMVSCVSSPAGR